MNTYNVTIKAEVYKTITVDADNEDAAYIAAHELFTVAPDFVWPESYNEETIGIELIEKLLSCPYCNGDCPSNHDYACDGFLGDIDNLLSSAHD